MFYSFKERIFLPDKPSRTLLAKYAAADKPLYNPEFATLKSLLAKHQPCLVPLLEDFEMDGYISEPPAAYHRLLVALSSQSSVCAIIHTDDDLQQVLTDLTIYRQSPVESVQSMDILCRKCPLLADLLSQVPLSTSLGKYFHCDQSPPFKHESSSVLVMI